MARIKIEFVNVNVINDGDNWPNGAGEIYYTLRVDNDIVATRARNQHISISSGQQFAINETHVIERDDKPGSNFSVSGFLAEADGYFTWGDDHAGSFFRTHSYENRWNRGNKQVHLRGDGVEVLINYKVTVL